MTFLITMHKNNSKLNNSGMMLARFTLALVFISFFGIAAAETMAAAASSSPPPSPAAEINTYVTIIVGALTGVATILGLPIVRLNQRKTKAEIAKLELEATALRRAGTSPDTRPQHAGDGIQIVVNDSPYTRVEVLADPPFLAPLLLLLDFVFVWVILTLASYFLNIFGFEIFRDFALAAIAFLLLLPIAKQALHIRSILRPKRTREEVVVATRQTKYVIYAIYILVLASCAAFSALILISNPKNLTDFGRYLGFASAASALALLLLFPILRQRVNRYLPLELDENSNPTHEARTE